MYSPAFVVCRHHTHIKELLQADVVGLYHAFHAYALAQAVVVERLAPPDDGLENLGESICRLLRSLVLRETTGR